MTLRWFVLMAAVNLLVPAADESWEALVKQYVQAYEAVKEPTPTAYPWVSKRLRTLFEVKNVGHIRVYSEKDGKRTPYQDVYYKPGELIVIRHGEGWNLITKGKEAYEWKVGEKKGIITKVTDGNLIEYLLYLTDPSYIMTCLYHDALTRPDRFLPPKEIERGRVEWRLKEPIEGFRAVFVSPKPAWLCGFEVGEPACGKPERVIYSTPVSLKEIPAEASESLKGIEFKKSDLSIRRHLVYL